MKTIRWWRLAGLWVLAMAASGCGGKTPEVVTSTCGVSAETLGEESAYKEGTNPRIGSVNVGIGNLFERDLADSTGTTASRMSAMFFIHDPATGAERNETVFAGSVVELGGARYCVTRVEPGDDGPGRVAVRALP